MSYTLKLDNILRYTRKDIKKAAEPWVTRATAVAPFGVGACEFFILL